MRIPQPEKKRGCSSPAVLGAARSGGYHYKFDGHQWIDTKGQGEFFASLSRYASEQAATALEFSA